MSELVGPPRDGVTELEIEGEVSLFVSATNRVVVLNETASAVWNLCDGTRTADEIVQQLAQDFTVTAGAITPDVEAALRDLRSAGVLSD